MIGGALFHEPLLTQSPDGMVIVRDIEFASTSEATLLPFYGRCHVAYMPRGGVVLGLSKLARLAKLFARQLQSQQRLTNQMLAALQQVGCSHFADAAREASFARATDGAQHPAEAAVVPLTVLLQAAAHTRQPQPLNMASPAQLTLDLPHDRLPCTAGACLTPACCHPRWLAT